MRKKDVKDMEKETLLGHILRWVGIAAVAAIFVILSWTSSYHQPRTRFQNYDGERYMVRVVRERGNDSMIVNIMRDGVLLAELVEYNSEWHRWGFYNPNRRFEPFGRYRRYNNVIRYMLEREGE